jgi:Fe-S-cluster containining protein
MVNNLEKESLKGGDQARSKQLMISRMTIVKERLVIFLDQNGVNLPALGMAMEEFTRSVLDLPEGTACQAGCQYCCHLRLGVSIPEVIVIYKQLLAQATPEGLAVIRQRIIDTDRKGNTLLESFWFESRTPCPFLNEKGRCLIYALRPFPCRAHHSTDVKICRESFEKETSIQIPCFTLYWASTDMYSSLFIKVLADKGFASFQVGFIKALEILFKDDRAIESWLNKEDVFAIAKLG